MLQHFTPGPALGVPRKVGGIVGEVGYAAAVTEQVTDADVGGVQTQLTCFNGLHDKNGGKGLRAEGREAGQQQEDESGFSFWVMHGNGFSLPPNYGKLRSE